MTPEIARPLAAVARGSILIACSLMLLAPGNCSGNGPVIPNSATITYIQVGACNGFRTSTNNVVNVGPNQAYVVFSIREIDNRNSSIPFNFDPTRLFVSGQPNSNVDPGLSLALAPTLRVVQAVPTTVAAGQNLFVNGLATVVVATTANDGATEARGINYAFAYQTQANDPGVVFNKTGPTSYPLPLTQNCENISYPA